MHIEETYFIAIKTIYEKPTANIIDNGGKLKAFLKRSHTNKNDHLHHFYST